MSDGEIAPTVEWLISHLSPWALTSTSRCGCSTTRPDRGTTPGPAGRPATRRRPVTASGDASWPLVRGRAHVDTTTSTTVPFSGLFSAHDLLTAIGPMEGGRGADLPCLRGRAAESADSGTSTPMLRSLRFTAPLATEQALSAPCSPIRDMVHLDGRDRIVLGCATSLEALSTHPADGSLPIWSLAAPLSAQTGGLQFLRRTPAEWTTSAWAMVGWPDRVQWVDADGHIQKTWVLASEETLIDAGVIDGDIRGSTATNALRLIRCNLDNGARRLDHRPRRLRGRRALRKRVAAQRGGEAAGLNDGTAPVVHRTGRQHRAIHRRVSGVRRGLSGHSRTARRGWPGTDPACTSLSSTWELRHTESRRIVPRAPLAPPPTRRALDLDTWMPSRACQSPRNSQSPSAPVPEWHNRPGPP